MIQPNRRLPVLPLCAALAGLFVALAPGASRADVRVNLGFGGPPAPPPVIYQAAPPPPVYAAPAPAYPWYYGPEVDLQSGYGHGGYYHGRPHHDVHHDDHGHHR